MTLSKRSFDQLDPECHRSKVIDSQEALKPLSIHYIGDNVERFILYKTAFPFAKKGVSPCQKARVGKREHSIYVLHRHFGNPKRLFMTI